MKELEWISNSKKDLLKFPKDVIQEVGYALYLAQNGEHYNKTKPFKGCGSGVYEIVIENEKNAYRSIYIVSLGEGEGEAVYVIHCFQKKSKRGIKTPKEEIEVIKQRLKYIKAELNKR